MSCRPGLLSAGHTHMQANSKVRLTLTVAGLDYEVPSEVRLDSKHLESVL